MLHVVHHPAYVSPATDGQQARFDKYGLVMDVLAETDFNISETARRLGMHRRTLARKLEKQRIK